MGDGAEHLPVAGSQVPGSWHGSGALHWTHSLGVQTPAMHRSPTLHLEPSSHGQPSLAGQTAHRPDAQKVTSHWFGLGGQGGQMPPHPSSPQALHEGMQRPSHLGPPHCSAQTLLHAASQATSQQYGSAAQVHASQGQWGQPGGFGDQGGAHDGGKGTHKASPHAKGAHVASATRPPQVGKSGHWPIELRQASQAESLALRHTGQRRTSQAALWAVLSRACLAAGSPPATQSAQGPPHMVKRQRARSLTPAHRFSMQAARASLARLARPDRPSSQLHFGQVS